MNKLLILALAIGFFLLFLTIGSLGGVGNASAVLLDWSTSKVADGKLSSTLPESVASGLGGLGNLLLACAGTLLLWAVRALHAIAGWIQSAIDSFMPSTAVTTSTSAVVDIKDTTADEATWEKCEALLEDAIFRGDRKLTIVLCERMNGKPYLTGVKPVEEAPSVDTTSEVPNA
jgi:hypothetical protein